MLKELANPMISHLTVYDLMTKIGFKISCKI